MLVRGLSCDNVDCFVADVMFMVYRFDGLYTA